MASIQHGFWGNGTVDGIQDYADALNAGIPGADGTTPLGQVKYYQYRLNRPYDFFRWRSGRGFQNNGNVNPSVVDYDEAKFLLGQTVPGHTHAEGVQGTIIALEYTWRATNIPGGANRVGVTAASIIRGNFDFGPRARMVAGVPENGSNAAGIGGINGDRWAARPTSFTAPTFGVSYGARSYSRPSTDFPSDDSWYTSFNRDSHRSGSPGSYTNTAGTVSLEAGSDDCYSLFELGLDILYLTSLYPDAVFMMDHVLEVNINHGANGLDDIPQDTNPDTALTRANYSDALLHIIAFLEAMGVKNVLHHIGIAGVNFWGGPIGNNESDPWWGNILAQEKNDSAYGVINPNYPTGRTWVALGGRDMYSGQNGATQYRSPADLVNTVVAWGHQMDKYVTVWTTGVTHLMDSNTPASGGAHAIYPKDGTLKTSGTGTAPVDGENFFSAFRWEGDTEMNVASPRLWGVCYQIGFESQDPHNDYNPESDSDATNRGTRSSPLPAPPITSGNIYGTPYDRTTLPPANARSGWRAFWDWLNAPKWKGGAPMLLPKTPSSVSHTTDAVIRKTVTKTHTTSAVIRKVSTKLHQTDARIAKFITRTHQTDAIIVQGTLQRTHATGAVIRRALSRTHGTDATISGSVAIPSIGWGPAYWGLSDWGGVGHILRLHGTDAVIAARTTLAQATDARILRVTRPAQSADGVIGKSFARTQSADANIAARVGVSHQTDARLLKVTRPFQVTDAIIRKVARPTHGTDAVIAARVARTHQTDAFIRPLGKVIQTTDAFVSQAGKLPHTTGAVILKAATKTQSTDGVIRTDAVARTQSADAIIAAPLGKAQQTDAVIRRSGLSRTHGTDARILSASARTQSADAVIAARVGRGHQTDAVVRGAGATVAHGTDAHVRGGGFRSQGTDALILSGLGTRAHSTDALVRVTYRSQHFTDAFISSRLALAQRADAIILASPAASHQTDAVIVGAMLVSHQTDAYLFDEYPFWPADETALTISWGEP